MSRIMMELDGAVAEHAAATSRGSRIGAVAESGQPMQGGGLACRHVTGAVVSSQARGDFMMLQTQADASAKVTAVGDVWEWN